MAKEVVAASRASVPTPVKIDEIAEGPAHIRSHVNQDALDELKGSIKKLGLLQPIVVMKKGRARSGAKKYALVVGSRRVQACKELGKAEIPAIVIDEQNEERILAASLAENMFRSRLSHKDTAQAVTRLYKLYGKNEKKVARATGMWPETVLRYVYLQEYGTKKMVDWVQDGKVTLLDVKRMLHATQWNIRKAEAWLEAMISEGMTRTQKKNYAEYMATHPSTSVAKGVEDAKRPRVQEKILVDLAPDIQKGIEHAMKEWKMEADEIAVQALRDWLEDQGYIE